MAVWAEPFTKLRLTKLYNLMQDPFERADITSNTYWDWIMNHVPQVYQGMEGVTTFVASFKEFPPRSVPPSFNPANMLEDTLRDIKAKQKLERAFPMLRAERRSRRRVRTSEPGRIQMILACGVGRLPGKGWFVYFRIYGPEAPAFDGSCGAGGLRKDQVASSVTAVCIGGRLISLRSKGHRIGFSIPFKNDWKTVFTNHQAR